MAIDRKTIDSVLELNIEKIISKDVELNKKGSSFTGCCPFHNEKSPSFSVSPSKGIFKCFGCGKSGNVITYIMEKNRMDFPTAVKELAIDNGIEVIEDGKKEDPLIVEKRSVMLSINKDACNRYQEELKNATADSWIKKAVFEERSLTEESVIEFKIGYAPESWDYLANKIIQSGNFAYAEEIGLIRRSKDSSKVYDFFRDRMIFPIQNRRGEVIGFSGRKGNDDNKDNPKYKNSKESLLYHKSNVLYGIYQAEKEIRKCDEAILVEGNIDVVMMHQGGLRNTIGTCGTALTESQAKLIKKLCSNVILIMDGDEAGRKATLKSINILYKEGLFVKVVPLGSKQDPDTIVKSILKKAGLKQIEEDSYPNVVKDYFLNITEDAIIYKAEQVLEEYVWDADDIIKQEEALSMICETISLISIESVRDAYVRKVCKRSAVWKEIDLLKKIKKIIQDRIDAPTLLKSANSTLQEAQKASDAKKVIGDDDSSDDYVKYGIFLNKSSSTYWSLDTKNIPREISNFKMRILYHINTGKDEAFRLMQITNIHGLDKVVRINTDDFVSAGSFKKVIARLGNFIWKGQDHDLVRLQDMLQRHEVHTELIDTLGWNRRGKFYAFANGLFDTMSNKFHSTDDYGIVEKEKINFFIPALSKMFRDKDDLFVTEKKFVYLQGKTSYEEWSTQFVKVFGLNGRVGLVFWACALFSDILFKSMGSRMPMPFSYGKRGSGKGTMTQSLLYMWGEKQDQIMLGGATTIVGFMRKMAQLSNGLVWLDEYKNNLLFKTIESIKNLYDRIGYERGKKDNGFSTESTPILSAVWLSGQEMPTIEPALFTRCILLNFEETKRSEEQRVEFRKLQKMEEDGISHLTMNMLSNRLLFESKFQEQYEIELRDLAKDINNNDVDERLLSNYAMLLATARIMDGLDMLPFTMNEFKDQCIANLFTQFFVLKGSDDTSKFWQVVEQLVNSYQLHENEHYVLANGYIYIYIQDVYHHYVKAMNERRETNILDKPTLENYLKSDNKSFIAKLKKKIGTKYSACMQFKYKELDIDIIRGNSDSELREKIHSMGLDYEESSDDKLDDGMPKPVQNQLNF